VAWREGGKEEAPASPRRISWLSLYDTILRVGPCLSQQHHSLVVSPPICERNVNQFDLGESLKTFL